MSVEDKQALTQMENSLTIKDGHYQMGLPWRDTSISLPNNRSMATVRLGHLKKKLAKDEKLNRMYVDTIATYISQGHAKKVDAPPGDRTWHLPHHPVLNPHKPNKAKSRF